MREDIKKDVKIDTQIIIIAVLLLTLISLGFSYASFFSIQSKSSIQEITAGTLKVVINGTTMNTTEIFPVASDELPATENAVVRGEYAGLTLTNEGNLDADYSVTLTYDTLPSGSSQSDLISMDYLTIGVYDEDENKWIQYGNNYYTPVNTITPTSTNVYPIMRSIIPVSDGVNPSVKQYRVYVWLNENTPATEIGKLVYLKLDIKSTTTNGHVGGGN